MDAQYVDDTMTASCPEDFHDLVVSFDSELAKRGASRGVGDDLKSTCRIVCPDKDVAYWSNPANQGWITDYIRATFKILPPNTPVEYLGAMVGGAPEATKSMKQAMARTSAKRDGINSLQHAASELILLRRVSDVANINFWLRCQGDRMCPDTTIAFDNELRAAVEIALGGGIPDNSWWQAELPVDKGGLGMRQAAQTGAAAFLASRAASRAMVDDLCMRMQHTKASGRQRTSWPSSTKGPSNAWTRRRRHGGTPSATTSGLP